MHINHLVGVSLLALSLLLNGSTPSLALEPITDALLDKADRDAKDVIARAEAAGNSVARTIGEQVLKAIQALRDAVHASIDDTKKAYLQTERDTYDNISKVLEQAQDMEHVSMTDVTSLLANVQNGVSNLPFVNLPPSLMFYGPPVIGPGGPSEIAVRVIGPKLASSNPEVSFKDAPVKIQKSKDAELVAMLDRKVMTFDEREPRYVPVKIKYDQNERSVLKPWTWFSHKETEREMTFLLLPKIMSSYSIQTKLNSVNYEYKVIQRSAGGHGMDNAMDLPIRLDPPDVTNGWKIDVGKLVKDGLKFSTTSGDGGASCSGLQPESLTPEVFLFRLTHGHKTDWLGHKSDVDVQCSMSVPLVKATPVVIDGPPLSGDVGWLKDVRQPLPPNLASYEIALKLFDSKEYVLDADTKVPYGLIEVTRGTDYVQFRPKPPADF